MNYLAIIIFSGLSIISASTQELSQNPSRAAVNKAESKEICGGLEQIVLTDRPDHGFISSPGYPVGYPNNVGARDCGHDLLVESSVIDSVRLGFLQLRTSNGDSVQVELRDENAEFIDQFAGTLDLFIPQLFAANNATVFLQSDAIETEFGYLAAYAAELPNNGKDEIIEVKDKINSDADEPSFTEVIRINTETGKITTNGDMTQLHTKVQPGASKTYGFLSSPNHPNNYANGERITFDLVAPEGSKIALRLMRLRLEPIYDQLRVFDGGVLLQLMRLRLEPIYDQLRVFDGGVLLQNIEHLMTNIIYSKSNEITVQFTSDTSNTYSGFLLAYTNIQPFKESLEPLSTAAFTAATLVQSCHIIPNVAAVKAAVDENGGIALDDLEETLRKNAKLISRILSGKLGQKKKLQEGCLIC
ncbi:unnamed protein product [Notodromas monacha]|uniref:CUB domain-containing protein n=1 Tax=Notodromas monacha TaxID=399045 RepID=A0A7R9GBB8_9CRUS|nr:unnamed protein product [Notodromas monacha]CAG0916186.1 unnamed protein product [Notodromas monacha]